MNSAFRHQGLLVASEDFLEPSLGFGKGRYELLIAVASDAIELLVELNLNPQEGFAPHARDEIYNLALLGDSSITGKQVKLV